MQCTLRKSVTFRGIGLHGGRPVTMTLRPAAVDSGIRFCRIDVTDAEQTVPARHDRVVDTRLCTRLENAAGVSVSTVEHLMAALAALGVDNLLVDIDGPEVPILDGSALPFVEAILATGLDMVAAPRPALRVLRPVHAAAGPASASLFPATGGAGLELDFRIDFPDAAIGRQAVALSLDPARFADELAGCRTFVRLAEIEALRRAGLARGGDLSNAVVVDGARVLNPGGLRRPDEFVRHKMLDAVGDLALAGMPLIGRYVGDRAGHGVTNDLLRALFADRDAFEIVPDAGHPAAPAAVPAVAFAAAIAAE